MPTNKALDCRMERLQPRWYSSNKIIALLSSSSLALKCGAAQGKGIRGRARQLYLRAAIRPAEALQTQESSTLGWSQPAPPVQAPPSEGAAESTSSPLGRLTQPTAFSGLSAIGPSVPPSDAAGGESAATKAAFQTSQTGIREERRESRPSQRTALTPSRS